MVTRRRKPPKSAIACNKAVTYGGHPGGAGQGIEGFSSPNVLALKDKIKLTVILFIGKPIAFHLESALCRHLGFFVNGCGLSQPQKGVTYVSRELWLDRREYVGLGCTCCFGGNRGSGQEDIQKKLKPHDGHPHPSAVLLLEGSSFRVAPCTTRQVGTWALIP
jgi:hypothetical protein